jgi:hypothetical protein
VARQNAKQRTRYMDLRALLRVLFVRDLNAFLVSTPISQNADEFSAAFTVAHRHAGPHELGVVCTEKVGNPIEPNGRLECHLAVSGLGDRIGSGASELSSPWYDGDRYGFSLVRYTVPQGLPLKTRLDATIRIMDFDGSLASYKPTHVYVRNISTL